MALATRTVSRDRLIKDGKADGRYFRRFQAGVAEQVLRREQKKGLFPTDKKQYVTKVDGYPAPNKSGAERKVKLDGTIQYIRFGVSAENFTLAMIEMIRKIMRAAVHAPKIKSDARSRTKFRRRHYRDSMALLRNNNVVIGPGPGFERRATSYIKKFGDAMQGSETLAVTNIQPYARRIEMGAHFKKPWSNQATRGVFKSARAAGLRGQLTKALYISQVEFAPLPGGISDREYSSQGAVGYAEGRNKRGRFVYSGRVMRKHRVYPVLFFGPPRTGARYGINQNAGRWTTRANIYESYSGGTIASQIKRAGGTVQ